MNNKNIYQIVLCGLGIALVFVLTAFIAIPLAQFGYVNLGDSGIMLFASILNPPLAFIVGGVGSALADIYLGYTQYAIFTLIVKGLEGVFVAWCFKKLLNNKFNILVFIIAALIMVLGYYLTDSFLYGGFIQGAGALLFNALQGIISVAIASVAYLTFFKSITERFIK